MSTELITPRWSSREQGGSRVDRALVRLPGSWPGHPTQACILHQQLQDCKVLWPIAAPSMPLVPRPQRPQSEEPLGLLGEQGLSLGWRVPGSLRFPWATGVGPRSLAPFGSTLLLRPLFMKRDNPYIYSSEVSVISPNLVNKLRLSGTHEVTPKCPLSWAHHPLLQCGTGIVVLTVQKRTPGKGSL